MNILYTDEFKQELKRLPVKIRDIYHKQEKIFRNDTRDPRLHMKKLEGYPIYFSSG